MIKINSGFTFGTTFINTDVEISISRGFSDFKIVGLAEKIVQESKIRIKTAIKNCGYKWPNQKIFVNLKPVDLPKNGSQFDLAITVGILLLSKQIQLSKNILDSTVFIGEIDFDGFVHSEARHIAAFGKVAIAEGYKNKASRSKILASSQILSNFLLHKFGLKKIISVNNINGLKELQIIKTSSTFKDTISIKKKFKKLPEIYVPKLQETLIQIASVSHLNTFLVGPPGEGKTTIAKIIAELKPNMSKRDLLEQMIIQNSFKVLSPPIVNVSHFTNMTDFFGDARTGKLGKINYATGGTLIINELTEVKPEILHVLKEVLDNRYNTFNLKNRKINARANFQFIATTNPCKCGYFGSSNKNCICREYEVTKKLLKIPAGLYDRFGIVFFVARNSCNRRKLNKENIYRENISLDEQIKFSNLPTTINILEMAKKFGISMRKSKHTLKVAKILAAMNRSKNVGKIEADAAYFFTQNIIETKLQGNKQL